MNFNINLTLIERKKILLTKLTAFLPFPCPVFCTVGSVSLEQLLSARTVVVLIFNATWPP